VTSTGALVGDHSPFDRVMQFLLGLLALSVDSLRRRPVPSKKVLNSDSTVAEVLRTVLLWKQSSPSRILIRFVAFAQDYS
jgi:hypothetical protein